jgi:(p)ppGpp synthase/HD superfamily hydrolase
MKIDIEEYKKALHFASLAHQNQIMPTGLPYVYHITSVAVEVISAFLNDEENFIGDINFSAACALLHDTIEDTEVSYKDLVDNFGEDVAQGVFALTKTPCIGDKKAQMADSIHKLLNQPYSVQCVKLADRITNLSNIPEKWSSEKLNKYLDEALIIYNSLGHANKLLANRLLSKINELRTHSTLVNISELGDI